MKTLLILLIIAMLVYIFAGGFIDEREMQKKYDMYIREREPLSDNEFYDRYFKAQSIPKEIPIKVRQIFAECLGIEVSSRLKNTEDLWGELSFICDGEDGVEIIMAVEEEFGIKIEDEEAAKISSIQDIVVGVWNKKKPYKNLEPTPITPVESGNEQPSINTQDNLSEPTTCIACETIIPSGEDTCSKCGWTYK